MGDKYYLYVCKCSDGSLYTGIAKNVESRIEKHNLGRGAKYTRSRRPVALLISQECPDLSKALKAERAFKGLPRSEKLKRLQEGNLLHNE